MTKAKLHNNNMKVVRTSFLSIIRYPLCSLPSASSNVNCNHKAFSLWVPAGLQQRSCESNLKNREGMVGDIEFWVNDTISDFRDDEPFTGTFVSGNYEREYETPF